MRKHSLYVIRRQGDFYRRFSLQFHRDSVTGERTFRLSGFGHMIMVCSREPIPELAGILRPYIPGQRFS